MLSYSQGNNIVGKKAPTGVLWGEGRCSWERNGGVWLANCTSHLGRQHCM